MAKGERGRREGGGDGKGEVQEKRWRGRKKGRNLILWDLFIEQVFIHLLLCLRLGWVLGLSRCF